MASEIGKGYSILIVDDDPAIRDIYESFLKGSAFTVYTAQDGEEGLEVARQHRPSLIILDLMMPHKDGRAMLKDMQSDENLKVIPVIIFSALIPELGKEDDVTKAAVDYIEKSEIESPEILLERIKQILKIK